MFTAFVPHLPSVKQHNELVQENLFARTNPYSIVLSEFYSAHDWPTLLYDPAVNAGSVATPSKAKLTVISTSEVPFISDVEMSVIKPLPDKLAAVVSPSSNPKEIVAVPTSPTLAKGKVPLKRKVALTSPGSLRKDGTYSLKFELSRQVASILSTEKPEILMLLAHALEIPGKDAVAPSPV